MSAVRTYSVMLGIVAILGFGVLVVVLCARMFFAAPTLPETVSIGFLGMLVGAVALAGLTVASAVEDSKAEILRAISKE